ncbi:MAG: hypothetical protein N2D54_08725 [Chloroflexota bacterium]
MIISAATYTAAEMNQPDLETRILDLKGKSDIVPVKVIDGT